MRRHQIFCFAILAVAFVGINGCKKEAPTGKFTVVPEMICPGEEITLSWEIKNATDARISPNIGTVNPSGDVKHDEPNADTDYKLEAKNNDVSWMEIGSQFVNIVGPGDFWGIEAMGEPIAGITGVGNLCKWIAEVPDLAVSQKVKIAYVHSTAQFTIGITHSNKTGTVTPLNSTNLFTGDPICGTWIFKPNNYSEFLEYLSDNHIDSCKDYRINVKVGAICP